MAKKFVSKKDLIFENCIFGIKNFPNRGNNRRDNTSIGGKSVFKTYNDFVKLACYTYKIKYEKADTFIRQRLNKFYLTPRIIVCYINWAGPECLSTREIANYLDITYRTIINDLQRLYEVWPHLFKFGPPIPKIQDMSTLPEDFDEYLEEGHNVEKF